MRTDGCASRLLALASASWLLVFVMVFVLFVSCTPKPRDARPSDELPPIYPDYVEVTIPQNIAPLNFLLQGGYDAVEVVAEGGGETLTVNSRSDEVVFPETGWRQLLQKVAPGHVVVRVTARKDGSWTAFKPFGITVAADSIDPYLTYRLIEPDYEVFGELSIRERCLENFSERALSDHALVGRRCMNCHVYGNQDPRLSMLYVRGEGGGAVLNRDGRLRKLGLKTPDMVSGSVYAQFSPDGRYLVFSTNVIIPAFHSDAQKRLEVFDAKSDIYVADLETNQVLSCPTLSDSLAFETFPCFSPDGRYIYYCTAPFVRLPMELEQLQYRLCRIGFDGVEGTFSAQADTLEVIPSRTGGMSVCHPRVSPDGKWLLYTVANYGTFPIWHPETDLQLINLETMEAHDLPNANSSKSDTYHSWSHNSRWFVFASKRDDGLYGKPYFCYVYPDGQVSKPFCLPQRDPRFYDHCLKSFNIPELGRGPVPFSAHDVMQTIQGQAEPFARRQQPR